MCARVILGGLADSNSAYCDTMLPSCGLSVWQCRLSHSAPC